MKAYQQRLEEKFKETFAQLNENQQKAVNTIEGPVMVIAGPGTGKTQILAARIGKILLETDATPENILCLTFTEAGVIAMRRRLQQFIGTDAFKVNIYTFHAFCNDVIQENLSLFEKNILEPISDLEQIELFKQLIDDFPSDSPLKRHKGEIYYDRGNLQRLFSIMKQEDWRPEFIIDKCNEYIESLKDNEDFRYKRNSGNNKKGDLKEADYNKEVQKIQKTITAALEFEKFQKLLHKNNRYDFDDMIVWVIRMFEQNPDILANYQEKFQSVLVDEFQDTSGSQNRIVELLINYWDSPNIFVVGDDDQSIFRFQGANIENMLKFANKYQNLETILLTNNYRSTQPILDVSKVVIDHNNDRLVNQIPGLSKTLIASNEKINHITEPPVINICNNMSDEMIYITSSVEKLITDGTPPEKIAVIYKENKYGEKLSEYFKVKNIPFYTKRTTNILNVPFIKKVIKILAYLDAEHDTPYGGDEMLFEILHFDFYNIAPIEIAKITVENNNRRYNKEDTSIRKLIFDKTNEAPKTLFDKGISEELKNIGKVLESLIQDVPNITLIQLFENVIRNAGVLKYVLNSPDKIELMHIITVLFDFIKSEAARKSATTLSEFMVTIETMKKEKLQIPLVQFSGSEKSVNLLTVHGSKGLEFLHVFFTGLNSENWESKKVPSDGFKLPETLFYSSSNSKSIEELRRLFYVALTRAEQHLYLSYANFRADGKPMERSLLLAEIEETHALPIKEIILTPEERFNFEHLQFVETPPSIEALEEAFINELLSKFSLSVTALNSYLNCPIKFYYTNLIRIPAGKNESTEFGSAVHHALEKLFTRMKENPDESFPPLEIVLSDFSWYMHKHRENFTPDAFKRRMELGEKVLAGYYDKYVDVWSKVVVIERNIKNVFINNIPLKGKLDKLEFHGKNVNVVDYKTGKLKPASFKRPSEGDPIGGDYWRQAVFYKILVENNTKSDWRVISTEFDFVEPDSNGKFSKELVEITAEDTLLVEAQIKDVWEKIQNKDFYTGCGKEDCYWCNFVKDNKLKVELPDVIEE